MGSEDGRRGPAGAGATAAFLALLAAAAALSLSDARRDAATADEPVHIADGVATARTGGWVAGAQHPPLARHLYGLAAIRAGATEPPRIALREYFRSSRDFVFADRPGLRRDAILLAARRMAVLLFLALLAATFRAAGGGAAGLLAAALLLGQTALFPHGHLAANDVPLVLFVVLAAAALASLVEKPSPLAGGVAAIATAAALATKGTGVILLGLIPLALAGAAWRARERAFRSRALVAALLVPAGAVVALVGAMALYTSRDAPGTLETLETIYGLGPPDQALLARVDAVSHPLARYLFVVVFHIRESQGGLASYFLGVRSIRPSPLYHLVAILVKSPAVWLLSVLAGAAAAAKREGGRRARLFLLAGLFFLAASVPGSRIGVRHVFPTIALLTVGAALALTPVLERAGRVAFAAAVLVALTPLLFGRSLGRNGLLGDAWSVPPLADSNLDWGQDLLRLPDVLHEQGIPERDVAIAYFGGDAPFLRIPGALDLLETGGDPSSRRYLAVSRQYLLVGPETALFRDGVEAARRALALLRATPGARLVARVGDSIELYDLRPPA